MSNPNPFYVWFNRVKDSEVMRDDYAYYVRNLQEKDIEPVSYEIWAFGIYDPEKEDEGEDL